MFTRTHWVTQGDQAAGAGAGDSAVSVWELLELFFDLTIVWWIYFALENTKAHLAKGQQSVKLKMYQRVARVLAVFLVSFGALTVLTLAIGFGYVQWPWSSLWILLGLGSSEDGAIWHLLNFIVVTAVCLIWRPTPNSSEYAHTSQLAQFDEDFEDEDVEGGEARGVEMTSLEPEDEDGVSAGRKTSDRRGDDFQGDEVQAVGGGASVEPAAAAASTDKWGDDGWADEGGDEGGAGDADPDSSIDQMLNGIDDDLQDLESV